MSLNQRRILYSLFILAFLILVPLISLYATGYQITSGLRVQKTGIFIVDSEPPGAKIYFNGKIQQNILKKYLNQGNSFITTPAKIKNISPGEYDIRVERDGYWPWKKKLEIKSGESTFAEDIFLFKNELPLILFDSSGGILIPSPDNDYLLSKRNNELIRYNPDNQDLETLTLATSSATTFSPATTKLWSRDADKLLLDALIIDINDWSLPRDLALELGENLSNIKWSRENNSHLFYSRNNTLYRYDINEKLVVPVLGSAAINDYHIENNNIFYVKPANRVSELILERDQEILLTIPLPLSSYKFINPNHNLLNLYDTEHDILYLVDPFNAIRPIRDSITNVNKTNWINNDKLLYANDFETWLLDLNSSNRTLLTRISQPIRNIIWHPSNNYIIYSTNNSLSTIELDQREKYNITKLIELDEIKFPFLNNAGTELYFYARIGRQQGIYKLNIQ